MQFGQIASDAWKKAGTNNDQKLINICVNLPSGGSVFAGVHANDGSCINSAYLKTLLLREAIKVCASPHMYRYPSEVQMSLNNEIHGSAALPRGPGAVLQLPWLYWRLRGCQQEGTCRPGRRVPISDQCPMPSAWPEQPDKG